MKNCIRQICIALSLCVVGVEAASAEECNITSDQYYLIHPNALEDLTSFFIKDNKMPPYFMVEEDVARGIIKKTSELLCRDELFSKNLKDYTFQIWGYRKYFLFKRINLSGICSGISKDYADFTKPIYVFDGGSCYINLEFDESGNLRS